MLISASGGAHEDQKFTISDIDINPPRGLQLYQLFVLEMVSEPIGSSFYRRSQTTNKIFASEYVNNQGWKSCY